MTAFHHTRQRARKSYTCWWCSGCIPKGSRYARWRHSDMGLASIIRCHCVCADAWSEAAADNGGDYHVMLGEFSMGCWCEYGRCRCGTLRRLYLEAFPDCQFCPEPERDHIGDRATCVVHHIFGREVDAAESWWNYLTACHDCHVPWAHRYLQLSRNVAARVKARLAETDSRHQIPYYFRVDIDEAEACFS